MLCSSLGSGLSVLNLLHATSNVLPGAASRLRIVTRLLYAAPQLLLLIFFNHLHFGLSLLVQFSCKRLSAGQHLRCRPANKAPLSTMGTAVQPPHQQTWGPPMARERSATFGTHSAAIDTIPLSLLSAAAIPRQKITDGAKSHNETGGGDDDVY